MKLTSEWRPEEELTTPPLAGNGDKSMVVSMEVNGVNYQGVLFAVNPTSGGENGAADPLNELFTSGYES